MKTFSTFALAVAVSMTFAGLSGPAQAQFKTEDEIREAIERQRALQNDPTRTHNACEPGTTCRTRGSTYFPDDDNAHFVVSRQGRSAIQQCLNHFAIIGIVPVRPVESYPGNSALINFKSHD